MLRIKQRYSVVALIIAAFIVSGCLTPKKENIRSDNVVTPQAAKPMAASGSIWSGENTSNLIFSAKKARYINDIVTIIISETAAGGNKASTNTQKDTNASAGITSLFGIDNAILANNATMGGKISLGGTSATALKGSGDTSRNSMLEAKISARVIKVFDNGNLLIEGRRLLTVNAEEQYIIISGIIRPDDIAAENTVASQYIADARIVYTGDGVINDKMRPGWLTRIVDWVWPF